MKYVSNDKNDIMKRKYGNRLLMAGRAIIMFGFWSSLRVVILSFFGMDDTFKDHFDMAHNMVSENSIDKAIMYTIIIVAIIIVLGVPFLVNFLIGRSAMREGKGGKRSNFYLVVCAFLLIGTVVSFFIVDHKIIIKIILIIYYS